MWAYLAAYKTPHDDEAAQAARVYIRYPIVADRMLGLGELPTVRLQHGLSRSGPDGPEWRWLDRVLVWAHWSWFMVPHGTVTYMLMRHPERFPRAAAITYAVFNAGRASTGSPPRRHRGTRREPTSAREPGPRMCAE